MSSNRTAQLGRTDILKDHADRCYLEERFMRLPKINADILDASEATRMIANTDFEIAGGSATNDDVTINAGGGIVMETDGGGTDKQVIVVPHLDAGQSAWTGVTWGTSDSVSFGCVVQTDSAVADTIIWAGLKLTSDQVVATDNDQVYWRYLDTYKSGNWTLISSAGASPTDTETQTDVTVAASTEYKLEIKIGADRIPRGYINGVLKAENPQLDASTSLIPCVGVEGDGTTAVTLNLRKIWISKAWG